MTDSISWLKRALPYIRRYKHQTFILKMGGALLNNKEATLELAEQITLLIDLGIRIVLVHGGGPQTSELSQKLGLKPDIVAGRRVTCDNTLEVVKMTLAGQLNLDLVSTFARCGVNAVGLTGIDSGLIKAKRRPPVAITDDAGEDRLVDFGNVGDIYDADSTLVNALIDNEYLPVIASLGGDGEGGVLNINADTVAEALAVKMQAKKLVFITEAPGILRDKNDPGSLVPFADATDLQSLLDDGVIAAGMRPKVEACLRACKQGVKRTHIISGLQPSALLTEIFTGEGCGTMIVAEREKKEYQESELG
ncbi:MAG TPA: acetylglutamate kinase [bacterium]|nr:acetylglutamate kinase [bacterium]